MFNHVLLPRDEANTAKRSFLVGKIGGKDHSECSVLSRLTSATEATHRRDAELSTSCIIKLYDVCATRLITNLHLSFSFTLPITSHYQLLSINPATTFAAPSPHSSSRSDPATSHHHRCRPASCQLHTSNFADVWSYTVSSITPSSRRAEGPLRLENNTTTQQPVMAVNDYDRHPHYRSDPYRDQSPLHRYDTRQEAALPPLPSQSPLDDHTDRTRRRHLHMPIPARVGESTVTRILSRTTTRSR